MDLFIQATGMGTKKGMHKYYFHIGDYRRDTGHLSVEEHGIYRMLLDELYLQETALSTEKNVWVRKLRLTKDQERLLDQVLSDFFILTENGYEHERVSAELSRIYDVSEQARANVNKRWEKIRAYNARNTGVIPAQYGSDTDTILPNNPVTHLPNKKTTMCQFDTFWLAYPKARRREKKKALAIWKRRNLDSIAEQIIADVKNRIINDEQWKKGYVPMPTTYLNGDRWEDELGGDDNQPSDFGKGGI
jgi:uncharacterized protein YdaU (DUF1376 family)